MQKCKCCNDAFKWRTIFKSYWWNYRPITCNHCGTKHRIAIAGRFTFVSLTVVPMLLFGYFLSPFENIVATLGAALLIFILGSLLAPFLIRYK